MRQPCILSSSNMAVMKIKRESTGHINIMQGNAQQRLLGSAKSEIARHMQANILLPSVTFFMNFFIFQECFQKFHFNYISIQTIA